MLRLLQVTRTEKSGIRITITQVFDDIFVFCRLSCLMYHLDGATSYARNSKKL